jgi:hypothetical protein
MTFLGPFGDSWQAIIDYSFDNEDSYHGTLAYRYFAPEMNSFLGRIAQFLDSLGVSRDLSIIWNAIPFTFIVDWFYNVGEFLHSERIDNYPFTVFMDGFCESMSCKVRRKTYMFPLEASTASPWIVNETLRVYDRRLSVPYEYRIVNVPKGLSVRKVLLSASMIWQQLSRR